MANSEKPATEVALRQLSTIQQYTATTRLLCNRYRQSEFFQSGVGLYGCDPDGLVDWLIGTKGNYARSTWRVYKAAIMLALEADGYTDQASRLHSESQTGAKRRGEYTTALRKKGLPDNELGRILKWLTNRANAEQSDDVSEVGAALWILAGRLTGLRPGEWALAELVRHHPETRGLALVVMNAKASNGRGNGASRTIPLHHLDEKMAQVAMEHFSRCRQATTGGKFDNYYRRCGRALASASRALWPTREKHYSLYSSRHQFSSDAKSQLPAEQVAALLGHASDETASRHYQRANRGGGSAFGPVPVPLAADVKKVRLKKQPYRAKKSISAVSPEGLGGRRRPGR